MFTVVIRWQVSGRASHFDVLRATTTPELSPGACRAVRPIKPIINTKYFNIKSCDIIYGDALFN